MLEDIREGLKYIDKQVLIIFPLAIFAIGAAPPLLEIVYVRTPMAEIFISFAAALVTGVEILRVRGKIRDASTWD